MTFSRALVILLLLTTLVAPLASADNRTWQTGKITTAPAAAQPSDHFDVEAATNAYLAMIPPAAKARSDAYFEGGYWLILWNFLYGAAVALVLLALGWSAAMRNFAERLTRFKPLQTAIYWVQYLLLTSLLGLPLAIYQGYYREHFYGMSNQTLAAWFGDGLKGLAVGIVLGAIIVTILFGIVRRLPNSWWVWGSVVTVLFLAFVSLIAPVYIEPLFNKISRLDDPAITKPILSLARANGIPADHVNVIDSSRQTTQMSAHVSGFGSTMAITLNDNLLHRATPDEIEAVMGHEMGHYVLNHVYKMIGAFLIIVVVWFAALRWSLGWSLNRWGTKWKIRGIGDTAVLPLVVLLSSIFFFVMTPVMNTLIRVQEAEADMYGINASRQPDGFAKAAIHLGEYRKMSPGPVEEFIFFDHPSGRNRIHAAMQWKAENLGLYEKPGK